MFRTLALMLVLSVPLQGFAAEATAADDDSQLTNDADSQARHFIGTLLGGTAGLALPLLLSPLVPSCNPLTSACSSVPEVLLIASAFLTMPAFAALGHSLAGGRANLISILVGAAVGLFLTEGLMVFDRVLNAEANTLPIMLAGAGLTIMTMAAATLVRERMLETRKVQATPGRFGLTVLGALLTQVGAFAGGLVLALVAPQTLAIAIIVGAVAQVALPPLVAYAIHNELGGRGSLGAAYLGGLIGIAAAAAGAAGYAIAGSGGLGGISTLTRNSVAVWSMVASIGLAVTLAIPTALEISHYTAMTSSDSKPKLSFAIEPINQGAMVMAGVTF